MYTPSQTASTSRATTVAGTPSSETQSLRNTMASSRNPNQTPTRTPTRLTEDGLATIMNDMDLQRRSSHQSLRPQAPAYQNTTAAQYYEELGRLRQQIQHKNAQIRQLQIDKELLDRANHAMHDEVSRDQAALRNAETERTRLNSEIARLNREKEIQQATLKQLQDQVAKQQKTIKVQSDQIANPRSASKHCAITAPYPGPHGGPFNPVYGQPAPIFGTSRSGPPSAFPPSTPAQPPAMSRDPSAKSTYGAPPMSRDPSATSSYGTPMSRQSSATACQPSLRPGDVPENMRIAEMPAYPLGNNQQLARVRGTESMSAHLLPEYAPFFNMVENWARGYCNVPDKEKDFALPPALIQYLKQRTNASALQKLMSSGGTRYLAVAKVMNQTLVNIAFRPSLLKGFTMYHDKKIADFRAQLQQVGMPLHVRRACLLASAETVTAMATSQDFKTFVDNVVSRQVHEMWACLEPLFAPGIARNEAWDDLHQIWREACRIGVLMLSKPSMFTCEFPSVGSNSRFNPSTMVSRDPNFKQDPKSLSQMAVTIRLSITPIVTETDFMGTGAMQPLTLYYSNVLLDL
ncbi:hypothetical protein N7G274_008320 [Stereocaulon virgatum]|uniref:Uncharacterized protein n=1 Tax=Stereocaulon virgatum TaxID=373712 RepID=A0ABR4A0J3_9LECA